MSGTPLGLLYETISPNRGLPVAIGFFNTASSGTGSDTISLGGYTTKTNDCIVVAMTQGFFGGWTSGGGGATWIDDEISSNYGISVGYACAGGDTSFSITTNAGTKVDLVWGVYRGIRHASNPIAGSISTLNGSSPIILTATPSVGQILVAAVAGSDAGGVWSTDGAHGWERVGQSIVSRDVAMQDQIARSTSVPFASSVSAGPNVGGTIVYLIPAP